MKEKRMSTRYLASTAMFAAVSFVLSYEPKDAFIVIAGLLYGPMTSVLISVIVSLIEMLTISSTGPYGFLMNVVSTCAFAVPAAWFYQKHRTQKDAVIGLVFGIVTMAVAIKGGLNAALTLLLYKPIVSALRSAHLAEPSASGKAKGSFSVGFTLFSLAVLITFVLLLLVLIGVI